jgi:radical SAM superfamily enzyme with C-terminal helix-hairpin-helix motif
VRVLVRGGEPPPDRERALMIATVAEAQGKFYHQVMMELDEVEQRYGRQAAYHDLLLALLAEQERRQAAEDAKPKRK